MNFRKSRPLLLMTLLLGSLIFLLVGSWLVGGMIAEANPNGPADHIDPEDIYIWQYLAPLGVNDFAIDPTNNANIYTANEAPTSLAYSRDYGSTWITKQVGVNTYDAGLSIAVNPVDPTIVYLSVTDDRIYRSMDSGDSWTRVDDDISDGKRVSNLYVHPVTDTLVFGSSVSGIPTVFRSDDGGDSWSAIPLVQDPTNRTFEQIFSHVDRPNRIYAVSQSDVYISEDAGLTWDLASDRAIYLAVAADDPDFMYRFHVDCFPYVSTNGGGNWTQLPRPQPPVCYDGIFVDPLETQIVYLTSQNQPVARSLDGGQTWENMDGRYGDPPFPSAFAIDPVDPTRLYVGHLVHVSILFDNESFVPVMRK